MRYRLLIVTGLLAFGLIGCDSGTTPVPTYTPGNGSATTSTTIPQPATPVTQSTLVELLSVIPDTPDNLKELAYSDYAALRKIYNIPENVTLADLIKTEQSRNTPAFSRINSATHNFYPSGIMALQYAIDLPTRLGYDVLQIDQDVQAGTPPTQVAIAKGTFDYNQIDRVFTAANATKTQAGSATTYTFALGLNPSNQAELNIKLVSQAFTHTVVLPSKHLLLATPDAARSSSAITRISTAQNSGSVIDNAMVKRLLDVFGPIQGLYLSTNFTSQLDNSRLSSPQQEKLQQKSSIIDAPTPALAGYAYYESKEGDITYELADYYASEASATKALPILKNIWQTGVSTATNQPYNTYFDLISAETQGQIVSLTLKPKNPTSSATLISFLEKADVPNFWKGGK